MALQDLTGDPAHYLRSRASLAWALLFSLGSLTKKRRPQYSWPQLFQALDAFCGGFFSPTQKEGEIVAAMTAIEQVHPKRVLEIGTYKGGTFFLLSRAANEHASLISLDLPGGSGGGGYSAWKIGVYSRLALPGQSAHFLRCDSHQDSTRKKVEELLGGEALDVLFIDGDHSYEGVKRDFALYSDLVRPGGMILLHDIGENPPAPYIEVSRFWQEIKPDWDTRELLDRPGQGYGIGVIVMPSRVTA